MSSWKLSTRCCARSSCPPCPEPIGLAVSPGTQPGGAGSGFEVVSRPNAPLYCAGRRTVSVGACRPCCHRPRCPGPISRCVRCCRRSSPRSASAARRCWSPRRVRARPRCCRSRSRTPWRAACWSPNRGGSRPARRRTGWRRSSASSPADASGFAMRGERVGGAATRVEVVTTGLLVQRLQRDPELPGVGAVVIDECHERHLDADLALAFGVDVRANLRDDLALVATSATADTAAMTRVLGDADGPAPSVTSRSTSFSGRHRLGAADPGRCRCCPGPRIDPRMLDHVGDVVRRALAETDGDVLVFLPGEREIEAVARAVRRRSRRRPPAVRAPVRRRAGPRAAAGAAAPGRRATGRRRELADRAGRAGRRRRRLRARAAGRPRPRARRARHHAGVEGVGGPARRPRRPRGAGRRVPLLVADRPRPSRRPHRCPRSPPPTSRVSRCRSRRGARRAATAWPGSTLPPPPALDAATDLLERLGAVDAAAASPTRGRRMAALGTHPRLARAVLDGAELVGAERAREVVAILADDGLAGRGDDLPRAVARAAARARSARAHGGGPRSAASAAAGRPTVRADRAAGRPRGRHRRGPRVPRPARARP